MHTDYMPIQTIKTYQAHLITESDIAIEIF